MMEKGWIERSRQGKYRVTGAHSVWGSPERPDFFAWSGAKPAIARWPL